MSADLGMVWSQNTMGSTAFVLPGNVGSVETHNHIHNRETLRAFWDKDINQGPLNAGLSLLQISNSGLFHILEVKEQENRRAGFHSEYLRNFGLLASASSSYWLLCHFSHFGLGYLLSVQKGKN